MEFSWITDIFSKMEIKFASISFLILRASVWCSWNTATNQRVKQENRGLWGGPENLLSFQPWSMRGSGGMLGHCHPWIPHGGGFRILGKGGFFSFAILIWSSSCLCKTTSLKSFNFRKKILLLNKANNNKNPPVCLKSGYLTGTTFHRPFH